MGYYGETYQTVETPLNPSYDPFGEIDVDAWVEDAAAVVQRRMLLVLTAVVLVVVLLATLVLPGTGSEIAAQPVAQPVPVAVVEPAAPAFVPAEQPEAAVAADVAQPGEPAVTGVIASFFTPEVQYWAPQIARWAEQHDLDPNIVATIMQIESCGNPQAVSVAGARGLFQVMPFHFSGGEDMLDPDTNARRGMNFFNEQLRYTGGDILLSFAGYNGGYAASGGSYSNWASETQRYYSYAKGIYEDATAERSSSETLDRWLAAGGAAGCQNAAARLNLN